MSADNPLHRLDKYLETIDEKVRTSRRASEVFFNMPDLPDAIEGEKLIRGDLDTTYEGFVKSEEEPAPRGDNSFAAIQDEYWGQAQQVGEISGAYPDAELSDYFKVNTERSEGAIRAMIRSNFDPVSPPQLLLDAIEQYAGALNMDIMTASRVATKHLRLQLPQMKLRAQELVESGIADVDATNMVFQDFVDVAIPASIARMKESDPDGKSVMHGFINKIVTPDASPLEFDVPPLTLSAENARGLTRVYKLERRPYDDEELKVADELARDPLIQATLLTFQMAIVDYSKQYMDQHPERMGHSLLPFSEFFVPTAQGFAANPKLLTVLCNNYLPAVAGVMRRKGIDISGLQPDDFAEAATEARDRRVFFAQIAKFNNHDEARDTVELDMFVNRVCPGMQVLTNGLSTWVPRIYQNLRSLDELKID